MKISRLISLLVVMLGSLALFGCAGHPETSIRSSSTAVPVSVPASTLPSYGGAIIPALEGEGPADIWLANYESRPNVLIVEKGTTVTWTNNDFWKPLTVVSDDGLFAANVEPSGGTFTFLFEDVGTFGYTIDPYSSVWQGVVIVTG